MSYTIRSGDTLSAIASRHHTSVSALLNANPRIHNANLIHPGEKLRIPGQSDMYEPPTGNTSNAVYDYVVHRGDTLSGIAGREHTTVAALMRANPSIHNANVIHVGDRIHVPGRSQPGAPQPAPTDNTPPTGPVSGIENRPGVAGNADQTIDFFMSKGLTRAQAAGIAGNLKYESGFRPDAVGDGGTSFGVAQWHNGRGDAMKAWTRAHGYSPTSFKGQLEYLWHELNNSERNALTKLRGTTSAYDAGMSFQKYFERPAHINPARGQAAQQYYSASLH
ncbi:MAG: LysM peptidoglycan-binding domain-containing protein [Flavobacteriales bacterium]|nr:LysM peptidoglycan-binding domain-containing protein [Flavobacteriales bacterium]